MLIEHGLEAAIFIFSFLWDENQSSYEDFIPVFIISS